MFSLSWLSCLLTLFLGKSLKKNLCEAVQWRDRQSTIFAELDGTIRPEMSSAWAIQVAEWEKDNSKPNPYEEKEIGMWYCERTVATLILPMI